MPGLSSEARDLHNALVMHFTVRDGQRSEQAPATDHIQKYQHARVHHWMRIHPESADRHTAKGVAILARNPRQSLLIFLTWVCKNNGLVESTGEKARHQKSKKNFNCFIVLTRADFPTPPEPRTTSLYSRMMQEINRPQYLKHNKLFTVFFQQDCYFSITTDTVRLHV